MIASIIRTIMSIRDPRSIAPVLLWSTVEETVVTLVANAPVLRILVFRGRSFANGQTSGHRGTIGYTRERSMHDAYEMTAKGNRVMTVVSSKEQGRHDISIDDSLVVQSTVEVIVESQSLKGKDGDSSSGVSSSWVP